MVWKESEMFPCPYCKDGVVKVRHVPSLKKEVVSRGSSINKRSNVYTKDHYTVLEDCPNCGASAKKIEKALSSGKDYKTPSRKSALERMKKAGLPNEKNK